MANVRPERQKQLWGGKNLQFSRPSLVVRDGLTAKSRALCRLLHEQGAPPLQRCEVSESGVPGPGVTSKGGRDPRWDSNIFNR